MHKLVKIVLAFLYFRDDHFLEYLWELGLTIFLQIAGKFKNTLFYNGPRQVC